MKAFLVRYGVHGRYASGEQAAGPLSFTDVVYTHEDWPSIALIEARMRQLHCPAYTLDTLTHIYSITPD